MIGRVVTRLWAFAATAVISMAAMLALPTAAFAGANPDVTVTPVLPSVSISVPPRLSYASYQVTVANNTSKKLRYFSLFGTATATPTSVVATFQESDPVSGTGTVTCGSGYASWSIRCDLPDIASHATLVFTVTFVAPTAGDQLSFSWTVVDCPPTTEMGASLITLVTQSAADIAAGFATIVPKTGGTFYTGVDGGGGTATPGSAATRADPFTTTVVVPSGALTTATVAEAVLASSCSPNYSQCYESNVTIPGTFAHLTIYLRIDASRISGFSNFANAVIYYQHTPADPLAPVPACGPGLPASHQPCIESRTRYLTTLPSPEWKGDWEFKIQALDNGRYIN